MKLLDIIEKGKSEKKTILYDLTRGWDKHLVMELLNDYFYEIRDELSKKYDTYEGEEEEEEEGTIYFNKFYFHHYEYQCGELNIHKVDIFFDVPSDKSWSCWDLYDAIEILENTLKDSLSEDELKLLPEWVNPLKTYPEAYLKVGVLFAKGYIKKEKDNYLYKEKSFANETKLALHINKNILKLKPDADGKFKSTTRNILRDTFSSVKRGEKPNNKSVYSVTRSDKIIKYCEKDRVTPVQEYKDKAKEFKDAFNKS